MCLKGHAPSYLANLLCVNYNSRNLRNGNRTLIVPNVKKETFAARSFSVIGPKWCNSMPSDIRCELELETFKKKLKTFLFHEAFNLNSDYMYY